MSDQLSSDLAALQISRDAGPPSNRGKTIVTIVLLGAAGVAAYFLGLPWLNAKLWKTEITATEIVSVSPAQASIELSTTGYVSAQATSKVGAKIPGRVSRVHVKEGDTVEKGQLLVELDDADLISAIRAAESRVAAARARAATARAQLAETEQMRKRAHQLAEKGAGPQAEADDLDARVTSLAAQVTAADADVRAQQAEVESLKVNKDYARVVAPIAGTVVTKPVEPGELVGPTAVPVVELADFSSLVVETDVPEGRLGQVKVGSPCEIVLDAFPGKRFRGQTVEIGRKVNRAKATIQVKVKFVDDMEGVLPDMAARVSFLGKELDVAAMKEGPKTVVPASAVAERGGAKVVYVIDQGKVRITAVTLGEPFGDGFVLLQGPAPGTRVVKNPDAKLADGQKIKEKSE